MTSNLDNSITSNIIYLDFSKPFDSVCHSKLIHVLNQIKIDPIILCWITEYLSCRTQQTIVEGFLSKPSDITSGVPQGSVLGPLLFILFLEALLKILLTCDGISTYVFADDLKLLGQNQQQLQHALNITTEWAKSWQLKIHDKKSEHITFHHKQDRTTNINFSIDNSLIPQTNSVKDLGIIITNNFKWRPYVSTIYSKAIYLVYQIIKSFKSRNYKFYVNQFKLFIRPLLEYNVNAWMPILKSDIRKVEQVQATFTRLVCRKLNIKYNNYNHRLHILNLETLEIRRIKNDLIIIYKILNNLIDLKFDNFFKFNQNLNYYNLRRHPLALAKPPLTKTSIRRNFFNNRCINLWNKLPEEIVVSDSLAIFKTKLNKFDLYSIYSTNL